MYSIGIAFLIILSSIAVKFEYRVIYLSIVKIYTLFEYITLSYYLYYLITNHVVRKAIRYSILPFCLYATFSFFQSGITNFNSSPLIVEFILLLIFIIFYFYEKIKTVTNYPLSNAISFWVCVGFFIYFAGNFFFLISINLTPNKEMAIQLQLIYSLVTITKNIILSLALFANEPTENVEELRIPDDLNLDEFTPTNPKTLQ